MSKYQKLDDIVVEFHSRFNEFDDSLTNLYKWLTAIVLSILVLSFCILGFLLLLMVSHSYFQTFGLVIIEWNYLLNMIARYSTVVLLAIIGTFVYLRRREKKYKNSYINDAKHQDRYENICNENNIEKSTLADFRTSWIRCKFGYENINYVCDVFDEYMSYKDDLGQAFTLNSFLSNYFVKGVFAVLATGGLGFIGAYYANKLSANPDIELIGIPLFINSFFLLFFLLSFIAFFYFAFIIIKDIFFEILDLFINGNKITEVRKKRLTYFLHQSRVLKINRILEDSRK